MGTTVVIATHNASIVARFGHPELRLAGGELSIVDRRAA
jgi:ABC-type ATPase involved in cell division